MDSVQFDNQRSINLFPIASEVGTSKSPNALRSVPGYVEFADLGGGPIRNALKTANGKAWVVSGYDLYQVNTDGTGTLRGTLLTGVSRVSMAENGTQLMIVDGTYGYILDMDTNTFSQITDVDFPADPTNCTFLNGYFIVAAGGTANAYRSDIYDGLAWDPLNTSRADTNPDNLVGVYADHGNLWMIGEVSGEVWQPDPSEDFGFSAIPGATIQTGCAAIGTFCQFDNSVAWLGIDQYGRGVVWKAVGYDVQRISTQAIEARISQADNFTDSYAYVYHEQGHIFYCLQIRTLDTTLVYDGATGVWHERAFNNPTTNQMQQHRGSCHFFFDQKNLIGDRQTGKIYNQDLSLNSFDGGYIRRRRISPHIQKEKQELVYSSVELDVQTGVGLTTGQGSDPQIMMKYSNDGGETWSNERWVTMGKIGKYKTRVRWSRCGTARDRVFWWEITDPVFVQMNACYINAT
jgi:hypothetical protein